MSLPPTPAPTSAPTNPLTLTLSPMSPAPTLSPTTLAPIVPEDCNAKVTIECKIFDRKDCGGIDPPNATCADGADTSIVTFGYSGNTCNPSGNNQGDKAFSEDCAPIPEGPFTALCTKIANGSDMLVEVVVVNPCETFTVSAPGGRVLPDQYRYFGGCRT